MSIVLVVGAVLAAALLVLTGLFSLAALWWGDLLDEDSEPSGQRLSDAA